MNYTASEFESIYAKCFPSAMRLAMSLLHDEDDARDAVHEAFLRLWDSKKEVINPTAFIVCVVRNLCLNRISALGTRERMLRMLTLEPFDENSDGEDQQDALKNAVDQLLTAREREVVEKIYTEKMSYKEAAGHFGVSTAAINKHLTAALRKLRNHFKTAKP